MRHRGICDECGEEVFVNLNDICRECEIEFGGDLDEEDPYEADYDD